MDFLMKKFSSFLWQIRDCKIFEKVKDCPEIFLVHAPQKTEDIFIDVYILGGTIIEEESKRGINHILEHYLLEKINKEFGGKLKANGNVAEERTIIYCKVEKNKFVELAPKFITGIFSPDFSDQQIFDQEKEAILNEVNIKSNNLERKIEKMVFDNRCNEKIGHFRSSIETLDSIPNLKLEDIQNWYKKVFNENNVKIFFSCYHPDTKIKSSINNLIKGIKLSKGEKMIFPLCSYSDKKIIVQQDNNVNGVYLALSLPWITLQEDYSTRISANFLLDTLFKWEKDGLNQEARNNGIYGFKYYLVKNQTEGLLTITCNIPADKILQVLKIISKHLNLAKKNMIENYIIDKMKKETDEEHVRGWRSNERLNWITDELTFSTWNGGLKKDLESIDKVTPKSIMDVANKYFDANKSNLVVYGKCQNLDQNEILKLLEF